MSEPDGRIRGSRTKISVYLPFDVRAEMLHEAQRTARTLSWVVQRAWMIAKAEIKRMPAPPGTIDAAINESPK